MRFDSISQRFGDNFIDDIAKAYRSEILRDNWIWFLWDEGNESSI
jgi:hypothetical protein